MYSEKIKTVKDSVSLSSPLKGFLKGLAVAIVFTVAVFAVAALLIAYTNVSENSIPVISVATETIGACISGYSTAKSLGRKGFLTGLLSGVSYILIIWIIAALAGSGFYFNKHFFSMLALSTLGGAIGGVLGVNLTRKKTNKRR